MGLKVLILGCSQNSSLKKVKNKKRMPIKYKLFFTLLFSSRQVRIIIFYIWQNLLKRSQIERSQSYFKQKIIIFYYINLRRIFYSFNRKDFYDLHVQIIFFLLLILQDWISFHLFILLFLAVFHFSTFNSISFYSFSNIIYSYFYVSYAIFILQIFKFLNLHQTNINFYLSLS